MTRRSETEEAIRAEVEEFWPGVTVEFVAPRRTGHPKAKFTFGGLTLSRAYPGTPSDGANGIAITLGTMRRIMRQMGAERSKPDPSPDQDRKRYTKPNEGRAARAASTGPAEPAQAKATVAEQLADHPAAQELAPLMGVLGLDEAGDKARELDPLEELLEAGKAAAGEPAPEAKPGKRALSRRIAEDLETRQPEPLGLGRRIEVDPTISRSGWGLYTDIEAVDYHLDPCPEPSLSNSVMDPLLKKTARDFAYGHPRRNELVPEFPVDPDAKKTTLVKIRGDVVHQLALGKGRGYEVAPENWLRFDTKESKAWKAEVEEAGLTPIKHADFQEALVLAEVVREAVKRALDGADYLTEVVFMYQEMTEFGPIWVRGMMDIWCPEKATILDPKITARLYDGEIERHSLAMGWDRQTALYTRAMGIIFPDLAGRLTFGDVLVNPDPPHVSRLWAPERAWIGSSARQCLMAFERFGECFSRKTWPGFHPSKIDRGPMPPWEDKRRTEQELGS